MSLVLELLQGHLDGTNYVEAIELVWIVQDPGKTSQMPRFETKVNSLFLMVRVSCTPPVLYTYK